MLHLHVTDGELVRTTPEHPFWVQGASRADIVNGLRDCADKYFYRQLRGM